MPTISDHTHACRAANLASSPQRRMVLLLALCLSLVAPSVTAFRPSTPPAVRSSVFVSSRTKISWADASSSRRKQILGMSDNKNDSPVDRKPASEPGSKASLRNKWEDETPASEPDAGFLEGIKRWFNSDEGREDVKTYFISLFLALLLRFTIIEPRFIPSLSMYPTFEVGDQLAVEKVTKRIKPFYRTEVVVFQPPQAFRDIVENQYGDKSKGKEALIKRIVAVEGDKVEIKNGKLLINDIEQEEAYTAEDAQYAFGPVRVPPENVLVLGDNRNHSLDGHIWGFLPTKNVIGRAVFVYWPPWRVGNGGMF